jgi:hypothetical protein
MLKERKNLSYILLLKINTEEKLCREIIKTSKLTNLKSFFSIYLV